MLLHLSGLMDNVIVMLSNVKLRFVLRTVCSKGMCMAHSGGKQCLMLCKDSPESIRSLQGKRNSNCGSSLEKGSPKSCARARCSAA